MKYLNFLIAFGIIFLLTACASKHKRGISEGEIHYSITYLNKDLGIIPVEALPRTLVLKFKDNNTHLELSSAIGGFGLTNITHEKNGLNDTYLKILGLKYYYEGEPGELPPGFEEMKGLEVNTLNETAVICGYECEAAEITLPDGATFKVFSTSDLDIKNPNLSNPYRDIPSVLMSYYFIIGSISMHLEAEAVYEKTVSDQHFERKDQYRRITREDMQRMLSKMLQ